MPIHKHGHYLRHLSAEPSPSPDDIAAVERIARKSTSAVVILNKGATLDDSRFCNSNSQADPFETGGFGELSPAKPGEHRVVTVIQFQLS
ncbi:hypothetical protein ACJ72_03399 [Emergomyces africanus]|uniref:Uncharacterized protein n=1 Tax=Emergomyces africanus TaxID=1955775 RepID=A0A1B7NZP8_9EURO|nr:hypothetical protein ACJ72_03399 [Emergomyces africanus]